MEEKLKQLLKEDFYSIYDIAYKDLCDNNKEFLELRKKINKLLEDNPKINEIYYDEKPYDLSKEEVKTLIKYLNYKREENELYEEQLLYLGMRFAYIIFKKSKILKDE